MVSSLDAGDGILGGGREAAVVACGPGAAAVLSGAVVMDVKGLLEVSGVPGRSAATFFVIGYFVVVGAFGGATVAFLIWAPVPGDFVTDGGASSVSIGIPDIGTHPGAAAATVSIAANNRETLILRIDLEVLGRSTLLGVKRACNS